MALNYSRFYSHHPGKECAVSPVVGIMLMLTITLILAAIISGFSGGIAQVQSKPPQLLFDASLVKYEKEGGEDTGFLDVRVLSVSEGIQTRDLRFQTEWRNESNVYQTTISPFSGIYPLGYDPGSMTGRSFGNYTLLAGSHLMVNDTSGMDAVLGQGWYQNLSEGTPVRIQFIHIPSGAIIADKEIMAEV